MGKKLPAKFYSFDAEGRQQEADIVVDEDSGEEVQPDDVKAEADKPSPKFQSPRDRGR